MSFANIVADRDVVRTSLGPAFATDRVRLSSLSAVSAATTRDASTVTPVPSRPERTP